MELAGNGFGDFAGLEACGADPDAADGAVLEAGFDALKIGVETPAGNAGDLFTDAAGLFGKTAAGNRTAYNRFFFANSTGVHKSGHYIQENCLGKPFFSMLYFAFN